MFKKYIAIILICSGLLLSGCTIPTNSSASVQTATSLTDVTVVTRTYDETNEYIRKIVSKRFTKRYEKYKERGYLNCPNEGFDYNWSCMLDDMIIGMEKATKNDFGYALKDINGDGVDELFFMRSDNLICSLFTFSLDNTVMLDTFFNDRKCYILDDGSIITATYDNERCITYNIRILPKKGNKLETNMLIGIQGNDYFKSINGTKTLISKEEYDTLISKLPTKNQYKLEFKPYEFKYTNADELNISE